MTTALTSQHIVVVEPLSPLALATGEEPRPLEGAQVLLVHGFASTPQDNWHRTRWVSQFHTNGATVHAVTLPYHRLANSGEISPAAISYRLPNNGQALSTVTAETLASYLQDLSGDIHLVGYSFGAQICWNVATLHPSLVSSLVVGAMPLTSHLSLINHALYSGGPLPEGFSAIVDNSPIPIPQLQAFASLPTEDFSPRLLPTCPTLFFRGENDAVARDLVQAYNLLPPWQSTWLEYPRRDHISILTCGKLKASVIEFMVRYRLRKASEASS